LKSSFFIAGTGTGVGKTIVTGYLTRYFFQQNRSVITQKWVQTGYLEADHDILTHDRICGRSSDRNEDRLPYRFRMPSSPHLAAKMERRAIDPKVIFDSLTRLQSQYEQIIIEGTGGLMVPFTEELLQIDLIQHSRCPVVLVIANQLGAINHAILSIEALQSRKIPILGLIFNQITSNEDTEILKENLSIINKITKCPIFGEFYFFDDKKNNIDQGLLIGQALEARLRCL